MSLYVTLRQEKTILSDLYRVVSVVTAANPAGMYPVFVVTDGALDGDEVFVRVATLDDFAKYVENPLIRLRAAASGAFTDISTVAGDIVEITNAPASWFDSFFFTPAQFTIADVDASGDWIDVASSRPFPTGMTAASWTVITRGSGTNGAILRQDDEQTTWLRRHWTSLFTDVADAESRVTTINTLIEKLVADAKIHGIQFAGYTYRTFA